MNNLSLSTIEELYGQPLALMPNQIKPEFKPWQMAAAIVISGLAIYGAYQLYNNYIKKESPQVVSKNYKSGPISPLNIK